MGYRGKTAFITGAAGAIGKGLVRACVEAGIRVAMADISRQALVDAMAELGDPPADRVMPVVLDIRDPESWRAAAERVEDKLGPVRLLFNNAGVTSAAAVATGGFLENLSFEEWKWTLSVNLDGVFLGLKTFVPRFKAAQAPCHIVNTSAMAAWVPLRVAGGLPLSYAASKAGINHLTAQLRTELDEAGASHVGVSLLSPGMVRSNIFVASFRLGPHGDRELTSTGDNTFAGQGVDPLDVGRYVLAAIERGQFHIFTHADWGPGVAAHLDEARNAFDGGADPGFADPAAVTVDLGWGNASSALYRPG